MVIFWVILATLYLTLAIVTSVLGRPVLKNLALLSENDTSVSLNEQGKEVGLESTLHRAYKAIIIIDTIGFGLAAIAAIISV